MFMAQEAFVAAESTTARARAMRTARPHAAPQVPRRPSLHLPRPRRAPAVAGVSQRRSRPTVGPCPP